MDNNNHNIPKEQPPANASMDQVREILFGAQLKDMEVRFKRQEDRLLREIHDVKESLKKRFDSLENFMISEVSSLLERLRREQEEREEAQKIEQRERTDALKNEERQRLEAQKAEERDRQDAVTQLNSEIQITVENFERKLAKLGNTIDTAERELRSLLLAESGSLQDKIENKYTDALNVLAKTSSQIRSDMVYRTALSGMFAEMVGGLGKSWNNESCEVQEEYSSEYRIENQPEIVPQPDIHAHQPEPEEDDLPKMVQVGSADNY